MARQIDQYAAARRSATRLALTDAQSTTEPRSADEVAEAVLPGFAMPEKLRQDLFQSYFSVFESVSRFSASHDHRA